MAFVLTIKELWRRRIYVAVGLVPALLLTLVVTFHVRTSFPPKLTSRQTHAWVANAVVLVDSSKSAIGDLNQGLDPLTPRATVYANLMTSPAVVALIGRAAQVPADEIAVSGPIGSNGLRPQHGATVPAAGPARYTLQLDTDETQPLIRITARAPTSASAVALASGAAAGLTSYVTQIEDSQNVPARYRVEVRDLGLPTESPSDSGISPLFGIVIFFALSVMWCMLVLLVSRFRQTWRAAGDDPSGGIFGPTGGRLLVGPKSTWDLDAADPWAQAAAVDPWDELAAPEPEPAALLHGSDRSGGHPAPDHQGSIHAAGPAPGENHFAERDFELEGPDPTDAVGDGHSRGAYSPSAAGDPAPSAARRWTVRSDRRR